MFFTFNRERVETRLRRGGFFNVEQRLLGLRVSRRSSKHIIRGVGLHLTLGKRPLGYKLPVPLPFLAV